MPIRPQYSFVLWAIPRFHRSGSPDMSGHAATDGWREMPAMERTRLQAEEPASMPAISGKATPLHPGRARYAHS